MSQRMMIFLGRREYGQRLPCADAHPHTTLAGALSVYDESKMKEGRPAAPMIGDQIPVSVRLEHLLVPEFLPHPPTGSRMAKGRPWFLLVDAIRGSPALGSREVWVWLQIQKLKETVTLREQGGGDCWAQYFVGLHAQQPSPARASRSADQKGDV